MVAKSNINHSWTKILQKHQNLKVAHISQYCTFNDKDFSFLIQITHFYNYQKIQVEVPYNSTRSIFLKMWQNSLFKFNSGWSLVKFINTLVLKKNVFNAQA
jgi:hypothetical protein